MKHFSLLMVLINSVAVYFELANPHPFWLTWICLVGNGMLLVFYSVAVYFHWRFWIKLELMKLINKIL